MIARVMTGLSASAYIRAQRRGAIRWRSRRRRSPASSPTPSTSSPSSRSNNDRDVVQPAQGRLRATPEGDPWRPSSPHSPSAWPTEASRSRRTRSARSSASTATPGSPRTSRRTRPIWARASRGCESVADGELVVAEGMAHANGGYFNFQPGEMYVGGGMWMPEKGSPGCLPAGRRRRAGSRSRSARGTRVRGGVRGGQRPRAPQAGPARASRPTTRTPTCCASRTSSSGGTWPTTRSCRRRSRTRSRMRTRPGCPCSASSTRSRPERGACDSARRSGSIGRAGRTSWPPAARSRRPAGIRCGSTTTSWPTRATRATAKLRRLDDPRGPRRPHRACPAGAAGRCEHVPQPGPDRQARDDTGSAVERAGRPGPRRRLVRARTRGVRAGLRVRVR